MSAVVVALASLLVAASTASAKAPGSGFVVGVVPQQQLGPADMQQMRSGSIESFRLWLNWSGVESNRGGPLDWSASDAAIGTAAREGVTPQPFLYGTPAWAAVIDGWGCSGADCAAFPPRSDPTRAAFASFAASAVARYGPQGSFWAAHPELPYQPIRSWQIWLEQNSPTYFAPEPHVRSYAALLHTAAGRIHDEDPEAEIVLGGMWGAETASTSVIPAARYLRRLYRLPGAKASFDSIAVHPYARRLSGVVKQIKAARSVAQRAKDRKAGLWVTELGWASTGPKGESLVYGPGKQARLLRQAFEILYRKRAPWRVRGVYWYAWQDTEAAAAICPWCPGAGLFELTGSPKPAWHSLTALAARLR